ncbi:hypothetical protein SAMN06272775_6674 [Streptomyces sp. 2323.1]|nr:hypothetical protein SAMN06272775_6674 [Streptomyces sp. 2323.1]
MVRGRNVHPQDAERIAAATHPALDPDAAAAFGFEEDGAEALALVLEADRHTPPDQLAGMADAVRSAVVAELDVAVAAVHFTRRGGIPRTTSGKLRRQACRDAWLQGALPPLATTPESAGPVAPVTAGAARDLRAVLAAVTRLSTDALDDSTGPLRRPADPAGRRGRHRGTATSRRMAPVHHRHPHRPPGGRHPPQHAAPPRTHRTGDGGRPVSDPGHGAHAQPLTTYAEYAENAQRNGLPREHMRGRPFCCARAAGHTPGREPRRRHVVRRGVLVPEAHPLSSVINVMRHVRSSGQITGYGEYQRRSREAGPGGPPPAAATRGAPLTPPP